MFLSERNRDPGTDRKYNQLRPWPILSGRGLEHLFSRVGNILRFVGANLAELDESEVERPQGWCR